MRWMLVALVPLLAASCTTMDLDDVWSKPDTNAAQVSFDDRECRQDVDQNAPRTPNLYIGGVADAVRVQVDESHRQRTYANCMQARGYTRISQ
jgi:hypothetical protein